LLEKTGKTAGGEERHDLAVVETATGAVHVLAPAQVSGVDAAGSKYAGWLRSPHGRGNDQISFVTPLSADKPAAKVEDKGYYDLGLYQLTADFQLKPIRTLSADWPVDAKPMLKLSK